MEPCVARAQSPASSSDAPTPLDRIVTVDLREATVREALDEIHRSTGVDFNFETLVVNSLAQRVTLHDSRTTLARALGFVLRGTGLVAQPFDSAIIVRQAPPSVVRGHVLNSHTGAPIPGATIVIVGLWHHGVTTDSGVVRMDSVPNGTFTVQARLLGYRPVSQTVTVTQSSRQTVEFRVEQFTGELERVVVTGTVAPTLVADIPTPISVITSDEMQEQHLTRVDEIFRGQVPGSIAWDQGKDDYYSTISVRGINSFNINNIKTYIDGVEVADPAYAAVDVNSIDHIEVIRGPEASTIYGSDASGGVMQIFTKHGDRATDHPTLDASVAEGIVQDPAQPGAALQQKYSVSLERAHGDASYDLGASYRHVGDWLPGYYSSDPSAYAGIHLDERPVSVQLSARYLERTFPAIESPALIATGIPAFAKPQNVTDMEREETYGLNLVYRPLEAWTHSLTIGYDRSELEETRTSPQHTSPTDTLLASFDQANAKASIAYNSSVGVPIGRGWDAVATIGFDHYERTSDQVGLSQLPAVVGFASSPAATINRNPVSNTGGFGQIQIDVLERLFLTGGLRADVNNGFGPHYGVALAPRIGASFVQSLGDVVFKARGSYGSAIQPGLSAQRDSATLLGAIQRANSVLAPERQDGGDGGVDLEFGHWGSFSVTYYNQRAHDLIIHEQVGLTQGTPIFQYQNIGEIKNEGLEISGVVTLPLVRLTAQYSYTSSKIIELGSDTTGSYRVGDQAQLVPLTSGGMTMNVTPWRGGDIGAGATYIGYWTSMDVVKQVLPADSLLTPRQELKRWPGFVKLRLTIDQQFGRRLSGWISVDNLTDNHAVEQSATFVTPGRTTTLGLRVQY
ncbi:MAG TPA: TonB-dependent receptor [Gemmatimonadaceae bacterium]|nr:TonB-dependent receptor [Gemmatimonadaceae bacterium]